MSRIDELIDQLFAAAAERLLLASGKPAVLTVGGDPTPLDPEPVGRDEIDGMVLVMGGDEELGQSQFSYDARGGTVDVTVRRAEKMLQVIITPAAVPALSEEDEAEELPVLSGALDESGHSDSLETAPFGPDRNGHRETEWFDPSARSSESLSAPDPLHADSADAGAAAPPGGHEGSDAPDELGGDGPDGIGLDGATGQESAVDDATLDGRGYVFGESVLHDPAAPPDGLVTGPADLPEIPPLEGLIRDDPYASAVPDPVPSDSADPQGPPTADPPGPPIADPPVERAALEVREDAPAMERLFLKMVEHGCSDIHVSAGSAPLFRKDGRIVDLGGEPLLSPRDSESLLMGITPERYRKVFEERNDADFAYEIPQVARFRCNLFRDRKGVGGVFRQIPTDILTAEALGIPPKLLELCSLKKGLILVTGPTGSGKSTTLAALIDHINRTREDHIITIEDPIEFVHENRKCLINQREVGEHTASFKVALRAALREDPDIVLVGELRDLETVEIALETAETGHLVFGTLHTNTAPGTVSRLIDQFPSGQQAQIRTMLADTLKAVIAQTLCRKTGGGRIAALEILVVNNAIANLIREDKAYQIPSSMQTGRAQGMRTLNDALLELIQKEIVTTEEAFWNAVDKSEFANILKRQGIELDVAGEQAA